MLSSLACLTGLAVIRAIHAHVWIELVVEPIPAPAPAPRVSVIIPARNEARNIDRCVTALLTQNYPNYEIIVVDDRSTDATPRILAELAQSAPPGRLQVITGAEPPTGWAGKPHALTLGIAQASGEWLCFIDADTFARPALLSATLTTAEKTGADMFSMLTGQILGSFWEKAILPVVFTALSFGFPIEQVNDPRSPVAIANGQFILIRRRIYDSVGGHAAVRAEIAEDKALAELVKRSGHRLVVADGRRVAETRMYTSLPEIWEGWTKNIYLGMRGRTSLLLAGALVSLVSALLLPAWLAAALAWFVIAGGWLPALVLAEALLIWAYLLWIRWQAAQAFGISPFYALTLPLAALLFAGMMAASAYRVLSGKGVRWKGRTYPST